MTTKHSIRVKSYLSCRRNTNKSALGLYKVAAESIKNEDTRNINYIWKKQNTSTVFKQNTSQKEVYIRSTYK